MSFPEVELQQSWSPRVHAVCCLTISEVFLDVFSLPRTSRSLRVDIDAPATEVLGCGVLWEEHLGRYDIWVLHRDNSIEAHARDVLSSRLILREVYQYQVSWRMPSPQGQFYLASYWALYFLCASWMDFSANFRALERVSTKGGHGTSPLEPCNLEVE